jgi:tRNA 2-thiouridine synthesizing protein E
MSKHNDELATWMDQAEAYMHKEVDTDIDSQQRKNREHQLHDWSVDKAKQIAREYHIDLNKEHLEVVNYLQQYYIDNGMPDTGRVFEELLADKFAQQGGRAYLHQLFPEGPVAQGVRIAGIPMPAHTRDSSFGTAR